MRPARPRGGMVDIGDLKSLGRKAVPVRVRPRAPIFSANILIFIIKFVFTFSAIPLNIHPRPLGRLYSQRAKASTSGPVYSQS